MGTLGIPSVTSCPSLQSRPHEENNLARSYSSANLSSLNQELLKLRSQRPKVKEMGAVNLFPSCDGISPSEQKSISSPSLLWYTWYCVVLNLRYILLWTWSILFKYRSTNQPVSESSRTLIICTILVELYEYSDQFFGRYISSFHLIQAKSSVNISSVLFEQTSQKMKQVERIRSVGISHSNLLIFPSIKLSSTFPRLDRTLFTTPPFTSTLSSFSYFNIMPQGHNGQSVLLHIMQTT